MKRLTFLQHIIAYVTLGLLCGWYHFLLILYPTLLFFIFFYRSIFCGVILGTFILLTVIPITHEPWEVFMYSSIFKLWCDYFDVTADVGTTKLEKDQKYMFFEFPHGIFPMGQFLSASLIKDIFPGHMICGTGADVIFTIPVMRQIMVNM
jgi:2-acylglycerol O-acyltransferase 2